MIINFHHLEFLIPYKLEVNLAVDGRMTKFEIEASLHRHTEHQSKILLSSHYLLIRPSLYWLSYCLKNIAQNITFFLLDMKKKCEETDANAVTTLIYNKTLVKYIVAFSHFILIFDLTISYKYFISHRKLGQPVANSGYQSSRGNFQSKSCNLLQII